MNTFDLTLFNWLHNLAGRWFLLDWFMIFFATWMAYILLTLFFVPLLKEKDRKKRWYTLLWVSLSAIVSRGIITEVIRFFYHRPRPFMALGFDPLIAHDTDPTFPSGHMAFYTVLILPLWYLEKKWAWIYGASVILMGVGRVYAGVHWPTDIIGGIILGCAVTRGIKWAIDRKQGKPAEQTEPATIE